MVEVIYHGSYVPLNGIQMSEAYASTLDISLRRPRRPAHAADPPLGGAALRAPRSPCTCSGSSSPARSASRASSTGSSASACSRWPRSRASPATRCPTTCCPAPGLRIAAGHRPGASPSSAPTRRCFIFGGEFPGDDFIPRLYTVHVLLIPGMILALITAHLMLIWLPEAHPVPRPGPHRETTSSATRCCPVYTAKAGGFFFVVFGVTALLGALAHDQPGVAVRALQPDPDHGGLPARLVHRASSTARCASCPTGRPTSGATRSA